MRVRFLWLAVGLGSIACSAGSSDLGERPSGSGTGGSGNAASASAGGGLPVTGFGGGDGFNIPVGGAGSTTNSGGAGGGCTGVTNAAEKRAGGKADIIFVLDNSGSMTEEAIAVQLNMNAFSQQIRASQIDANVVVISSGPPTAPAACDPADPLACLITGIAGSFTGANGVCIEPPLGTPGVCPDGDDTNVPGGYMHWREEVGSHDALAMIQSTFSGWQVMLRPDAATTFVVVTDDDANAAPSVAEFTAWVDAQPVFATSLWRFSGVFCATDGGNCANIGTAYQQLVAQTGGISGDLANFSANSIDQEFSTVFNSLANAVIADAVPVQCEWVIPPPPQGETLDPNLVNVKFSTASQVDQPLYGVTEAECPAASDFLGWYYDDPLNPQRVIACAATCPVLQADDTALIEVQFGCEKEPPPDIK